MIRRLQPGLNGALMAQEFGVLPSPPERVYAPSLRNVRLTVKDVFDLA